MSGRPSRASYAAIFVVAALAAAAGVWLNTSLQEETESTSVATTAGRTFEAITLIDKPRTLPDFTLTDQDSNSFAPGDFKGQWTLVFSGFTSCGHFCPMTMARIRVIYEQVDKPMRVVFLSVDPGRDTPEVIKNYVTGYNESFTGITGDKSEIDKLTKAIEAPYVVDTSGGKYTVDHASDLFLINPEGQYAGFISQPLDSSLISTELNSIL